MGDIPIMSVPRAHVAKNEVAQGMCCKIVSTTSQPHMKPHRREEASGELRVCRILLFAKSNTLQRSLRKFAPRPSSSTSTRTSTRPPTSYLRCAHRFTLAAVPRWSTAQTSQLSASSPTNALASRKTPCHDKDEPL